jgi:hypothetical protein
MPALLAFPSARILSLPHPFIATNPGVDSVIQEQLERDLSALEKKLDADVMAFVGPIIYGADEKVRRAVEEVADNRAKLAIVLETGGGVVEVVERIVDTLRHHYGEWT